MDAIKLYVPELIDPAPDAVASDWVYAVNDDSNPFLKKLVKLDVIIHLCKYNDLPLIQAYYEYHPELADIFDHLYDDSHVPTTFTKTIINRMCNIVKNAYVGGEEIFIWVISTWPALVAERRFEFAAVNVFTDLCDDCRNLELLRYVYTNYPQYRQNIDFGAIYKFNHFEFGDVKWIVTINPGVMNAILEYNEYSDRAMEPYNTYDAFEFICYWYLNYSSYSVISILKWLINAGFRNPGNIIYVNCILDSFYSNENAKIIAFLGYFNPHISFTQNICINKKKGIAGYCRAINNMKEAPWLYDLV